MTRSDRRWRRIRAGAKRRRIIRQWHYGTLRNPEENALWTKCAKYNFAHGCWLCHFAKYSRKEIRKRRRELDREIELTLLSWSFDPRSSALIRG